MRDLSEPNKKITRVTKEGIQEFSEKELLDSLVAGNPGGKTYFDYYLGYGEIIHSDREKGELKRRKPYASKGLFIIFDKTRQDIGKIKTLVGKYVMTEPIFSTARLQTRDGEEHQTHLVTDIYLPEKNIDLPVLESFRNELKGLGYRLVEDPSSELRLYCIKTIHEGSSSWPDRI